MRSDSGLHAACQSAIVAYVVTVATVLEASVALRQCSEPQTIVNASRSTQRRSTGRSRPRTLVDVRRSSSTDDVFDGRLTFGLINIWSLDNKVDDLLQVRRERGVEVLWFTKTWHDADSVCFRRMRSDGYRVIDRPRPRPPSESSTLSTNHGGVAIVSVPGIRLSVIQLGVDPTSFELLCVRVVSHSSTSIVVLIYRPGS